MVEALFRGEDENKLKAFEHLLGDDIEQYSIDIDGGCVYIYAKDKNPYIDFGFKEDIFNKIITATRASSINKICINSADKNTQTAYIYINKGIDFKNIEIESQVNLRIDCEKKGLVPLMNLKKLDMCGNRLSFYRTPKLVNIHIENANKIFFRHTIHLSPCKNCSIVANGLYLDVTDKFSTLLSKLRKLMNIPTLDKATVAFYLREGKNNILDYIEWDSKSWDVKYFTIINTKTWLDIHVKI